MAATASLSDPSARRVRGGTLLRRVFAFCGGVAVVWLTGFVWFLFLAARGADPPAHVDAIVVLTGGPERVEVALRLLASGAADRLLVSGAGERTDVAALAHLAGLDPAPLRQRITLGRAAHNTRGNAVETAAWVRERGIGSLLVVTAWFHMPRAMVELRRSMPAVVSRPYPVGRLTAGEMIRSGTARRVIGEYHKYLATLAGVTALPFVGAPPGPERAG